MLSESPFLSPQTVPVSQLLAGRLDADQGFLLGNEAAQFAGRLWSIPVLPESPRPDRPVRRLRVFSPAKFEILKRQRFTPEGRDARVRRSLAALDALKPLDLEASAWQWIAEDPDAEDQFS